MSIEGRINMLRGKHEDLEAKLDNENSRPKPDEDALRSLKHKKLEIKDEIERIQQTR